MDAVLQSGKFKDKEIRWINYCRLYLQAVTISDLTQANGIYLDEALLDRQPNILEQSKQMAPRQPSQTRKSPMENMAKSQQNLERCGLPTTSTAHALEEISNITTSQLAGIWRLEGQCVFACTITGVATKAQRHDIGDVHQI
jgi:hypothetical protein